MGAIAFATYRFNDGTLFPGTRHLCRPWDRGDHRPGSGPRRPLQDRHVCLAGACRAVGRISYWYLWHWPPPVFAAPLGKLSLEGSRPSRLPRPGCCDQSPHRALPPPKTLNQFPRKALALGGACTASSVALGLLLFAVTPSVPEARRARSREPLQNGHSLQKSASRQPRSTEAETKRTGHRCTAAATSILRRQRCPSASTATLIQDYSGALR